MKNLKLILRSLLSNSACVEGGRHRPWFFAVPLFVFSILISIIPIFVQTYIREGDSSISTYSYGLETSMQRFVEDINEKEYSIKIVEGDSSKRLEADLSKWNELCDNGEKGSEVNGTYYSYWGKDQSGVRCWSHKNSNDLVDLQVYYLSSEEYVNETIQKINYVTTKDESGNEVKNKRGGSYMILSEKEVYMYVQNVEKSKTDVATIYGNYNYFEANYSLNKINGGKTHAEAIASESYLSYVDTTWENWRGFYKTFYLNTRFTLTWQTTLLMAGVNAGLTIFMGLMVWLLTRGKNNPFRIFTIWECQKISAWCALTPAILACGLAFLITQFAQVMFALLLGVRVMWLSMKTLRPESSAPSQSSYSKPVKTVDTKPAK